MSDERDEKAEARLLKVVRERAVRIAAILRDATLGVLRKEFNWLILHEISRDRARARAHYDLWRAVAHEQDQRERTRYYGRQN